MWGVEAPDSLNKGRRNTVAAMDAIIDFIHLYEEIASWRADMETWSLGGPARPAWGVGSLTGLAILVFVVVGCAPDPEQLRAERTIDAEYDRQTGQLELITFDSDDNGTIDTWSYMDGNTVLRIELDADEDGTIDRWEYYLEDQTLEKVGFSRGNDGVVDAWAFEGADGDVVRIEISTVGDGQVDRWEFYDEGLLVRAEEDVDLDTRPDKWETYDDGRVSSAAFDETGDGRPDRRLVYAAGALVAIESDPAEDGMYRTRIEVGR